MGTTAEKLQAILNSKNAIKNAINTKGGNVGDVLSTYADAITNLPSGGDGGEQLHFDITKFQFVDYDGNLVYSYNDDEILSMTELPAGPDHTDDNLTFQGWNWTLEGLKNTVLKVQELANQGRFQKTRPIIGPYYITTDGKTYVYLNTPIAGKLSLRGSDILSLDWGDGSPIETYSDTATINHEYALPGKYTIIIEQGNTGFLAFDTTVSDTTVKQWITEIKSGNNQNRYIISTENCYSLEKMTIPGTISRGYLDYDSLNDCHKLKYITLNGYKDSSNFACYCKQCWNLLYVSIPEGGWAFGGSSFYACYSLKYIYCLPRTLFGSSFYEYMFYECFSLPYIEILNAVDGATEFTLGSYVFNNCKSLTIDLSTLTNTSPITPNKVLSGLNLKFNKLIVPDDMLQSYDSTVMAQWNNIPVSSVI